MLKIELASPLIPLACKLALLISALMLLMVCVVWSETSADSSVSSPAIAAVPEIKIVS